MSDSDSASSPDAILSHCFCGRAVDVADGSIYCSVACARSDAFSSLCYKPSMTMSQSLPDMPTTPNGSFPLSRDDPTASNASGSTSASEEWNASHYRRLARADVRRDERREERKRRRAENSSLSSSSSSRVPDLVGGAHSHSRNASVASTASSSYTAGSLSRNPSAASTASSRRFGNGVNVDSVIMEDEDEEEWLSQVQGPGQIQMPKPYAPFGRKDNHHRRRASNTGLSSGKLRQLEAFGMGKDMRDVLEEIIQMEKGFTCSDTEEQSAEPPAPGLYTANFDKPPRTPSPMAVDKRQSVVPPAPGAPNRGHRVSQSYSTSMVPGGPAGAQTPPLRGPIPGGIISGHQSSLSESHTALYLATASPVGPERRSASPKLQARKSLTFTPDKAGPSIGALRPPRFDSPLNANTPSRRRGNNSPNLHHPTMDGWKFPTAGSTSVTPTRPPPINTTNLPNNFTTPVGDHGPVSHPLGRPRAGSKDSARPQLLWPPTSTSRSPLAPALFPCSPLPDDEEDDFPGAVGSQRYPSPVPGSGLRLGQMLGSGGMDVDMDGNDSSTEGHHHMFANPHGFGQNASHSGYFPVFLEAESYQSSGPYPWAPEQP